MSEVKIPDSLRPENIMDTIEEREALRNGQKRRRRKKILTTAASVAVCALGVSVAGHIVLQKVREEKMDNWEWSDAPETIDSYEELYEIRSEVLAYNELKAKISWPQSSLVKSGSDMANSADVTIMEEMADGAVESINDSESGVTEHSDTNVQTEGVEESDWVKTDGEYIYHINMFYNELEIIRADGAESELVGQYKLKELLELDENIDVGEGYLCGDRLVLQIEDAQSTIYDYSEQGYIGYEKTSARGKMVCLDVSDKENVTVDGSYEYEGDLVGSRMQGDTLFVVTRKEINYKNKASVPIEVDGETYPADKVQLMEIEKGCYYQNYTCVASINTGDEIEILDTMVYATYGIPEIYMSTENLYLYSDVNWSETEIIKNSIADGEIEYKAEIKISGYLNDQFSLDEYQGYLRMAYTDSREGYNVLEIYDENMKSVGRIDNIAYGESIYSVRFLGNLGYFVTYRQTDPLYCVDLSDPTNPRILGFLKIPGFSTYLHPIDEDTMFGIGYEDGYLKISLFDVSDSENPKETQVLKFQDCYHAEAAENHKALLVTEKNTVFGFSTESYRQTEDSWVSCEYVIMAYADGALKQVETLEITDFSQEGIRAAQCGDSLYVLTGSGCSVYAMEDILGEENASEIAEVKY